MNEEKKREERKIKGMKKSNQSSHPATEPTDPYCRLPAVPSTQNSAESRNTTFVTRSMQQFTWLWQCFLHVFVLSNEMRIQDGEIEGRKSMCTTPNLSTIARAMLRLCGLTLSADRLES